MLKALTKLPAWQGWAIGISVQKMGILAHFKLNSTAEKESWMPDGFAARFSMISGK